jgi:hypothetical protein
MHDDWRSAKDAEGTFARRRGNDGYAPIPAVRGPKIELRESTRSWLRRPMSGSTKKQTFALNFYT